MIDEESLVLGRYVVTKIINENRCDICFTDDLDEANNAYEYALSKRKEEDHFVIFIYDYDKNTNINYYDSLCDTV